MELTKERKILASVLCLGLGALAVDHFVLASPDAASADEVILSSSKTSELSGRANSEDAAQASAEDTSALPSYASLSERLVALKTSQNAQVEQTLQLLQPDAGGDKSDPFALPDAWDPKPKQNDAGGLQAGAPEAKRTVPFLERNRLMATFSEGDQQRAVVYGQKRYILGVNSELDGYKVKEIKARSVTWESTTDGQLLKMHVKVDVN